jgi:Flp pilus assembly protein TadG
MIWHGTRRRRPGHDGQALVEFALIFPIFMVMMLALMQWSHMYMVHQTLTHAVREAGRVGIVGLTNNGTTEQTVLTALYTNSNGLLPSSKARVFFNDMDITNGSASLGGPTAVFNIRVQYRYQYHTPLVGFFNAFFGANNKFNNNSNLVVSSTFQAEKYNDDF